MHRIVTEPNIWAEYQGSSRIFAPTNNAYEYSGHHKIMRNAYAVY